MNENAEKTQKELEKFLKAGNAYLKKLPKEAAFDKAITGLGKLQGLAKSLGKEVDELEE